MFSGTRNLAVYGESGDVLGTVALQPDTVNTLYECHSFIVELYGRVRTIFRLYIDHFIFTPNGKSLTAYPQLLLKLIKGDEDVAERLDYTVLAHALERAPTNGGPIRIYFQDKVEDHNIRNL